MQRIISDFRHYDDDFGKKGNNLKILADLFEDMKNVIVPDTMVISKNIFYEIIKSNEGRDLSNYEEIVLNKKIEEEIIKAIRDKFKNNKLVVRSSATCEDSIFFSGSGQYDSFLNVSSDDEILDAIKKVYASFFSENSKLYTSIYNMDLSNEAMLVLIQKVAPVISSGVMFSCSPVTGEKKFIFEWTKGLGTAVVEGIGNINSLEISANNIEKIKDKNILALLNCLLKIREKFGTEVDVEWGIDKNNNIYIFQARPVVSLNNNINIYYDTKNIDVNSDCESISRGFAIGKVSKMTDKERGTILYQNEKYDFNYLKDILESKGIILKEKSLLSHFANITRELYKPCVYSKTFCFEDKLVYIVDGFNHNIIDFDTLSAKQKINFLFIYFEYLNEIKKYSYEKFNGIIDVYDDSKIEQVIFDIDEKKILKVLSENNYNRILKKEEIYTYDTSDNSFIDEDTIFRIQKDDNSVRIQLKSLDKKKFYRQEKGIIIEFNNLENAKLFMDSLGMNLTGYQERKIKKYVSDDSIINIVKWPGCEPYLGIEVKNKEDLFNIHHLLGVEDNYKSGMGGKEIFDRLNLKLNDCNFKENVKCKRKK